MRHNLKDRMARESNYSINYCRFSMFIIMWYECVCNLLHASVVSKKQAYVGIAETTTYQNTIYLRHSCADVVVRLNRTVEQTIETPWCPCDVTNFEIRAPGARNMAQVSALDLIYRPEKYIWLVKWFYWKPCINLVEIFHFRLHQAPPQTTRKCQTLAITPPQVLTNVNRKFLHDVSSTAFTTTFIVTRISLL